MELKKLEVKYGSDSVEIPYYEVVGEKDGQSLFVSAGMHGNEINGIYLVGKFIEWARKSIDPKNFSGRLIIFPVLNPSAFEAKERRNPIDGKDLNRQFAVETPTSISEQIAYDLTHKILKGCMMGIDIHDSGNYAVYVPHARIHLNDEEDCISCTRNMARIFGSQFILEREGSLSMMAVALNNNFNVPVITVEVGGAQMVYPSLLDFGFKGIKNVLVANRMLEGKMDLPKKQYVVSYRYLIKSLKSGYIELNVELGQSVEKGQEIGTMYYPIEQSTSKIIAPIEGNIFSHWFDNQVRAGVNVCSIIPKIEESPSSFIEMENFSAEAIRQ